MTTTSHLLLTSLADLPTHPLHWLWQDSIPLGHLTLLEGPPGIGTSLLALHLAACVSRGLPLPDGSPCPQGSVILIAPLNSDTATLTSRVQAAGGDPAHVLPLSTIESCDTAQLTDITYDYRPFSLLHDLPLLEAAITQVHATLVILDPISLLLAHTSLSQRVTIFSHLSELAQRTGCAILLLRPISHPSKTQLANPSHLSTSAARDLLLSAVRSRLLLLPDPTDPHHTTLLLHCPKHTLGPQPPTLAACIEPTTEQCPTLLWLGLDDDPSEAPDATILSQARQELLSTLRDSETALDARTLSRLCLQPYHTARKTLQRMLHDGQLVSPARGLYTTPGHLCLLHFPSLHSSVPTVAPHPTGTPTPPHPSESLVPTSVTNQVDLSTPTHPSESPVPSIATTPASAPTPLPSFESPVPTVASVPITALPSPHPSSHPSESPVPIVTSTPNQSPNPTIPLPIPELPNPPPELPLEDRSPSVMIRPRKEPEIYPGW